MSMDLCCVDQENLGACRIDCFMGHFEDIQWYLLFTGIGEMLGTVSDITERAESNVKDLCMMSEDTLVVPRYEEKTVLFYKLT